MHFIGIFANNLTFEIIKVNILKKVRQKNLKMIHIQASNIENMRNISFETILIADKIDISNEQKNWVNKLCNHCKYIIINSDMCAGLKMISNEKINCITYGLNQKSTITVSSIQNEKAIIYIQRNIKSIEQHEIEMGEVSINLKEYQNVKIENLLAIISIYLIYS